MAQSNLPFNVWNTTKTGTISHDSNVTIAEERIKQTGKIVEVHFYATRPNGLPEGVLIGTISGVDLPPKHIRAFAGTGGMAYEATNPAYIILSSVGRIEVSSTVTTDKVVNVDFVYTVD